MKPLILILLAATYAAAQTPTIADVARQERARRGQNTNAKVYTIKMAPPPVAIDPLTGAPLPTPETAPAAGTAPAPAAAPGAPAATAATPETPGDDPVRRWLEDTEKLRARIRQLSDQEMATQLEINSVTNRIYTPITSVAERDRAQAELGVVQGRLAGIREELTRARLELQVREKDGPPKK
jgi:Spy/CpxP family protein refolding chaperone